MILPLVILYVVTLVYLSITERFRTYASIIGLQGWILFGVALLRLHRIDLPELLFISVETLLFKALLVPALLFAVIRRTHIHRRPSPSPRPWPTATSTACSSAWRSTPC